MTWGLVLFLIVLAVDLVGLGTDALRKWVWHKPTISQLCWKHPELAIAILAFNEAGIIGLALHLLLIPKGLT